MFLSFNMPGNRKGIVNVKEIVSITEERTGECLICCKNHSYNSIDPFDKLLDDLMSVERLRKYYEK